MAGKKIDTSMFDEPAVDTTVNSEWETGQPITVNGVETEDTQASKELTQLEPKLQPKVEETSTGPKIDTSMFEEVKPTYSPEDIQKTQAMGALGAGLEGAGTGLTYGWDDEIRAYGEAVKLGGGKFDKDIYQNELEKIRKQKAALAEEYPLVTPVSMGFGALASSAAMSALPGLAAGSKIKSLSRLGKLITEASPKAKMALNVTRGATEGALANTGYSEEQDPNKLLEQSIEGGLIGGSLSYALPTLFGLKSSSSVAKTSAERAKQAVGQYVKSATLGGGVGGMIGAGMSEGEFQLPSYSPETGLVIPEKTKELAFDTLKGVGLGLVAGGAAQGAKDLLPVFLPKTEKWTTARQLAKEGIDINQEPVYKTEIKIDPRTGNEYKSKVVNPVTGEFEVEIPGAGQRVTKEVQELGKQTQDILTTGKTKSSEIIDRAKQVIVDELKTAKSAEYAKQLQEFTDELNAGKQVEAVTKESLAKQQAILRKAKEYIKQKTGEDFESAVQQAKQEALEAVKKNKEIVNQTKQSIQSAKSELDEALKLQEEELRKDVEQKILGKQAAIEGTTQEQKAAIKKAQDLMDSAKANTKDGFNNVEKTLENAIGDLGGSKEIFDGEHLYNELREAFKRTHSSDFDLDKAMRDFEQFNRPYINFNEFKIFKSKVADLTKSMDVPTLRAGNMTYKAFGIELENAFDSFGLDTKDIKQLNKTWGKILEADENFSVLTERTRLEGDVRQYGGALPQFAEHLESPIPRISEDLKFENVPAYFKEVVGDEGEAAIKQIRENAFRSRRLKDDIAQLKAQKFSPQEIQEALVSQYPDQVSELQRLSTQQVPAPISELEVRQKLIQERGIRKPTPQDQEAALAQYIESKPELKKTAQTVQEAVGPGEDITKPLAPKVTKQDVEALYQQRLASGELSKEIAQAEEIMRAVRTAESNVGTIKDLDLATKGIINTLGVASVDDIPAIKNNVDSLFMALEKISPEQAPEIRRKANLISKQLDLLIEQKSDPEVMLRRVDSLLTQAMGSAKDLTTRLGAKLGTAEYKFATGIKEYTKDSNLLKSMSAKALMLGYDRLSQMFSNALTKEGIARNAALFTILNDPELRKQHNELRKQYDETKQSEINKELEKELNEE
jgi:hypothetical protein